MQYKGVVSSGAGEKIVKEKSKKTTDISCCLTDDFLLKYSFFKNILDFLWVSVTSDYFKDFHSRCFDYYEIFPSFVLQKYEPPGGHFNKWHCEYDLNTKYTITRVAAWMLYLNSLDEGCTEFFHQNKTIKPEKGKLLIWPSFYTHIHKGNPVKTKNKYIMTGWITGIVPCQGLNF